MNQNFIQLTQAIAASWRPASCAFLLALLVSGEILAKDDDAVTEDDLNKLETLVVTATRLPRTTQDIAGTISVITAEAIEHQLVDDLDDLARFLPGITMDTAVRGGHEGFRIRGIGGNRVLTVIDGVRGSSLYKSGPVSHGIDSFETDNLKAVEFIYGPASMLYGADALGGVIVLTSKGAADYIQGKKKAYVNLRSSAASADNQYKLGLTGAYKFDRFGLVTQLTRRKFSERKVKGVGRLDPQDGTSYALLVKTSWDLSRNQQLRASLDVFSQDIDSRLGFSARQSFGLDKTDRVGLVLEYQWDTKTILFDQLRASVNQQYSDILWRTKQQTTSSSSFRGTLADQTTDYEFDQNTVALAINLRKTIDIPFMTHTLAYGFNYDATGSDRLSNACDQQVSTDKVACRPSKTFPNTNTKRIGIYLQNEIIVTNTRLTIIPGMRYDRYRLKPQPDALVDSGNDLERLGGDQLQISTVSTSISSISLGVICDLSDKIALFAQYSEGYRPASFDEVNKVFLNLAYGYASVPNPKIRPESSKGLELGIKAGGDRFNLSLAAYRNDYKDFIESRGLSRRSKDPRARRFIEGLGLPEDLQNISLYQRQNIARVRIQGAEITVNWLLGRQWQLQSSLAFAMGKTRSNGAPLDSTDPLTAVVGLRFGDASTHWGGELLLTSVDKKDRVSSVDKVTADSYFVLDLLGHYRINKSMKVNYGIFNLLNKSYAHWSNIQGLSTSGSSAVDTANTVSNAQQPGINTRISFAVNF